MPLPESRSVVDTVNDSRDAPAGRRPAAPPKYMYFALTLTPSSIPTSTHHPLQHAGDPKDSESIKRPMLPMEPFIFGKASHTTTGRTCSRSPACGVHYYATQLATKGISNILPMDDYIHVRTLSHSLLWVDVHVFFAQDSGTAMFNKVCSTAGPQFDISSEVETLKRHAL
jgi:hypothetical protein